MVISQYAQSSRKLLVLSIVSEPGVGQLVKWWKEAIGLVGLGLRDIVDWLGPGLKQTGGHAVGILLIVV